MTPGYESRGRYLALALDVRRGMDLLIDFIRSGNRPEALVPTMRTVVNSFESMGSAESLLASLQSSLPFRTYEQITILDEVTDQKTRENLATKLAAFINEEIDIEAQKKTALEVLNFFYEVEARALQHFNRPRAIPPTSHVVA